MVASRIAAGKRVLYRTTIAMPASISIRRFRHAIEALPSDKPVVVPGRWYTTQKEHWLGWLREYLGPGAYNRIGTSKRDARYAYNHIVEVEMLLWLISAAGISRRVVQAASRAATRGKSLQARSAAVRRVVPWEALEPVLWPQGGTSAV